MSVLNEIRKHQDQFQCGDFAALYLFGSAARAEQPSDIDLLLIYDERNLSSPDVRDLRKKLRLAGQRVFRMKCDVVALSIEEEAELSFIISERAIRCF